MRLLIYIMCKSIIWCVCLKKHIMFFLVGILIHFNVSAYEQNFSCPFGSTGTCLDYGDKVCSTFGKCVGRNAVCFDEYTCGFGGFVCKSDYESLSLRFDTLVMEYDTLVMEYNLQLEKQKRLLNSHSELLEKYNNLVDEYNQLLMRNK